MSRSTCWECDSNGSPIAHEVGISREWGDSGGCWLVKYGGVTVRTHRGPFLDWRVTRASRLAVRRHDWGQVKRMQERATTERLTAQARRVAADERGFTLIELAVTILMVAVLLAIAIPTFIGAKHRAEERNQQQHQFVPTPTTVREADPERFEQRRVGDLLCAWNKETDKPETCVLVNQPGTTGG